MEGSERPTVEAKSEPDNNAGSSSAIVTASTAAPREVPQLRRGSMQNSGEWFLFLSIFLGFCVGVCALGWIIAERHVRQQEARAEAAERRAEHAQQQLAAELERTAPRVIVDKVWQEHGWEEGGKKGMRIHAQLDVNNWPGQTFEFVAFFYFSGGDPIRNSSASCHTVDGNVCGHDFLTPKVQFSHYEDFSVFVPYEDIVPDYSGKWNMKFQLLIRRNGEAGAVAQSDWQSFDSCRPGPCQQN